MKKRYSQSLILIALLTLISIYAHGQKSILFIGRESVPDLHASDKDLVDSLTSWGLSVSYLDDSEYQNMDENVYTGLDGIFFNEPIDSKTVTNFGPAHNYPLPCICLEGYAPRQGRWEWITDNTTEYHSSATGSTDELSIVIIDNSHYVTEIFDINEEIQWSTNTGDDLPSITLGSIKEVNFEYSYKLAKNKAIVNDDDFWNMVTIDSSDAFPNRMFFWSVNSWGLESSTADQHYGTNEFFRIIKRASEWTYGLIEPPSSLRDHELSGFQLAVFPNPASKQAAIRFSVPGPAKAIITLYDVTGQLLNVLLDKKVNAGNNSVMLDVSAYTAGVYLVKLQIDEYSVFTRLIIE